MLVTEHLYSTAWLSLGVVEVDRDAVVLVLGHHHSPIGCGLFLSAYVARSKNHDASWAAVVIALAAQAGPLALLPLSVLEVALTLVQGQAMMTSHTPTVQFLTPWAQAAPCLEHAGAWGLGGAAAP